MKTGHNASFYGFQKELGVIRELTKQAGANHPLGWGVCYDGPLCPEEYFNTPLKVMWLLKEPYVNDENKTADWAFEDEFKDESIYPYYVRSRSHHTWQPVTYVAHGLHNSINKYDDMEDVHQGMMKDLGKIAFVNLSKHPAKGRASSPYANVLEGYQTFKEVLLEQIDVLNPSIIICGGTFDFIHDDLDTEYKGVVGGAGYYFWGNRIIIYAYHPRYATTYGRAKYIDEILEAIRISRQLLQS